MPAQGFPGAAPEARLCVGLARESGDTLRRDWVSARNAAVINLEASFFQARRWESRGAFRHVKTDTPHTPPHGQPSHPRIPRVINLTGIRIQNNAKPHD